MALSPATIGIDVGGRKMLFALLNEKFKIVEELKIQTPPEKEFEGELLDCFEKLVRAARSHSLTLRAVGVGCAGDIDGEKGVVNRSPNIPFLKGFSFAKKLAKAAPGVGIFIGNDVHLGLFGEHRLGAAVGLKHVIGVFIGTGVGGAIIIDGRLHLGASGNAGEIGHFLVSPIGHLTGSERQGVLDEVVSGPAIAGAAASIASKNGAPKLHKMAGSDVKRIRSRTLAESIKKGDKNIEEMVRSRARLAGIALSGLVDFMSPEMVVLGGGVVEAMPGLFLEEIGKGIRNHTVSAVRKTVKIAVAKLKGHSATIGAAKMALDRAG